MFEGRSIYLQNHVNREVRNEINLQPLTLIQNQISCNVLENCDVKLKEKQTDERRDEKCFLT